VSVLCIRSNATPEKDGFRGLTRLKSCPRGFTKYSKNAKECPAMYFDTVPYAPTMPTPVQVQVCHHRED